MSRFHRAHVLLVLLLATLAPFADAALYQGDLATYRQPDGSRVQVRIYGDEFYADEETTDGWRVIRDPATRVLCYARLSADGRALESTGRAVGSVNPATLGLRQHLRIPSVERRAVYRANQTRMFRAPSGRPLKPRQVQLVRAAPAPAPAPGIASAPLSEPPTEPTLGTRFGLTLLIAFPDRPDDQDDVTQAQVVNFCNQLTGYTEFGNNGSVFEYYYEVSNGRLSYTNHVTAYYVAAHNRDYYTDQTVPQGVRAQELIKEALDELDQTGYNFRVHDLDNDGYIDCLNCFYAGEVDNDWAQGLWPHMWYLMTDWSATNGASTGIKASIYQITNMGTTLTLGTFCHENGHMMCGFPDIYDYDYDSIGGAGIFCLMNSGGHGTNPIPPCGYLRYKAGWGTATAVSLTGSVQYPLVATIPTTVDGRQYDLLANQFLIHAKNSEEYFLIENRNRALRDARLPTGGAAIWHVDEKGNKDSQSYLHTPDNDFDVYGMRRHYECALIQADNLRHFERAINEGDARDLFYSGNNAPGYSNSFNDGSDTGVYDNNAHWWDGTPSLLNISGFSAPGRTLTITTGDLAILSQPQSLTVHVGQVATFSVNALYRGEGTLTYQWYRARPPQPLVFERLPNATRSTYSTSPVIINDLPSLTDDQTVYYCDVISPTAIASSSQATLTVLSPPVITTQINISALTPATPGLTAGYPFTVNASQRATFAITAAANRPQDGPVTYQWQRDGSDIANATGATYQTPSLTLADSGHSYRCLVSNPIGVTASNTAILTIRTVPRVIVPPTSTSVSVGQTATFRVSADGTPPFTYRWEWATWNPATRTLGTWTPIIATMTNHADTALYTTPLMVDHAPGNDQAAGTAEGEKNTAYRCIVSNPAGSATSSYCLLGLRPSVRIDSQTDSITIPTNGSAPLQITVTGAGVPLKYEWYKSATVGDVSTPVNRGDIADGNGGTATFITPPLDATTQYWVRVTDGYTTADSAVPSVVVVDPNSSVGGGGDDGSSCGLGSSLAGLFTALFAGLLMILRVRHRR